MANTNIKATETVKFLAKCKPFSSYGTGEWDVMVDPDGTVYVYDAIARHYTLCHALSEGVQRRIRREAAKVAAARKVGA